MRVAALAFGVLAGLVASLILALGGLDVVTAAGGADRQAQAIRFGLFLIGNIGMFAAALALAAPLAGGILMVLGALAWAVAAVLLRHTTDFVLITPPALMLVGAILAIIAHFRRRPDEEQEPDVEIIAPARERPRAPNPMESDEGVTIPSFAEAQAARSSPLRGMGEEDKIRGGADDNWDPRKRRPPPPRAKAAFRQLDEDDDDEPSGFSRFALGFSGILSFGLYAALAGAAVLIFWSARNVDMGTPTAAALDTPASSSSALPVSSAPPAPISSASAEPTLAPVLTSSAEPTFTSSELPAIRSVDPAGTATATTSPSTAPSSASEADFGEIIMPIDPNSPPRLSQESGLPFDEAAASSEEPSAQPLELEPSEEPPAELEAPLQTTGTGATPAVMPFSMTPRMAALRTAPGTGPTQAAPSGQSSDSGL